MSLSGPTRLFEKRGPGAAGCDRARRGACTSLCRLALLIAIAIAIAFAAPAKTAVAQVAQGPEDSLSEPQQVVHQVSEGLRRVLREDRALLVKDRAFVHRLVDRLFLPHVDFRLTCALVLGPVWERATAGERDAFMDAFKTFLVNVYATAVDEFSEWEIRYLPVELRPGDSEALVRTRVLYGGGDPIDVDYRMRRTDGRWRAYDVKAAGIGFVAIFRSSFQPIVRQKGLPGLVADLRTHNAARLGVPAPTRDARRAAPAE